jgi:hypothetical protein
MPEIFKPRRDWWNGKLIFKIGPPLGASGALE